MGLFTTVQPKDTNTKFPTYRFARETEAGSPRKTVLVAHILATLSNNVTVQDEDMALPTGWDTITPDTTKGIGHKMGGRSVVIHALAVLPDLQGSQVGTTLLKTFIQIMKDSQNVDRVCLITWEKLTPWYERFGFENHGLSNATFGGEKWYDMVCFPNLWFNIIY